MKDVIAIFDYSDDENELENLYGSELEAVGIDPKKVKSTFNPNVIESDNYDVLLFDWGGMSLGNSLMEHFCERIFNQARNCPSRHFVMLSMMTGHAMNDLLEHQRRELEEIPHNIFCSLENYAHFLERHKAERK